MRPKVKPFVDGDHRAGYSFYCPGCKRAHHLDARWAYDPAGPTFTPSLRNFIPAHEVDGVKVPERTICHLHLVDGVIQFLPDCEHELRGQGVPLVDWPEYYQA